MTNVAFREQANALFRKNLTYQKRSICTNVSVACPLPRLQQQPYILLHR